MHLTKFIAENHQIILDDWIAFAKSLKPWSKGLSNESLRDHAEELLNAVVADMTSPQTIEEQDEKSKGHGRQSSLGEIGTKHARDRLESGISIEQLVSEFRALRASVLKRWEQSQGDKSDEVTRFNEAIDEALAESTSRYSSSVNTTREQFLGILGHDLRNPIGAIIMGANLLRTADDSETREIAQSILNSGNRMSRMVNDLLDLTRTKLGTGIPIKPAPMNLGEVCIEVLNELKSMHPDEQIEFSSNGDLIGTWDSDRLAQVISNLTSNAIQYGTPHQPIRVQVNSSSDSAEVTVSVHNEGPSIPKKTLTNLFSPMTRGDRDADSTSNATGLGLGLFIASEIVISHAGKISVKSSENGGTTFQFTIPRVSNVMSGEKL